MLRVVYSFLKRGATFKKGKPVSQHMGEKFEDKKSSRTMGLQVERRP